MAIRLEDLQIIPAADSTVPLVARTTSEDRVHRWVREEVLVLSTIQPGQVLAPAHQDIILGSHRGRRWSLPELQERDYPRALLRVQEAQTTQVLCLVLPPEWVVSQVEIMEEPQAGHRLPRPLLRQHPEAVRPQEPRERDLPLGVVSAQAAQVEADQSTTRIPTADPLTVQSQIPA